MAIIYKRFCFKYLINKTHLNYLNFKLLILLIFTKCRSKRKYGCVGFDYSKIVDEAEDGVRNDVHQLFGDSAFVSRFPEEPAQREPERFWNRRFELFSFLGSYLQPNQQRQSMIRQLKEVHYGKNNRDNID